MFTDNELGGFVTSSGSSSDFIDPDIGHPWTDDMTTSSSKRELMANLGARVGFVYKKSNHLSEDIETARVASLFHFARQELDPGPDGIRGNGDDGAPFTVFDIPTGVTLPASIEPPSRLRTTTASRTGPSGV